MSALASPCELGIVVALAAEAEGLAGRRASRVATGARIAIAGIGAERSAAAAAQLIDDGARVLLSWGIAGGLAPWLAPGDLLVPERIVSERGEWTVDAAWRERIAAALQLAARASAGSLWCSDRPVASVADKRVLAARGMAATDMESAAVAATAARAGLPFVAVKAICDPAARALPAAALELLGSDGRLCLRRLPGAVRAGPPLWRELKLLHADFAAARGALRQAAVALPRLL